MQKNTIISEKFITLARSVAKINPNIKSTKLQDFYNAFEKEIDIIIDAFIDKSDKNNILCKNNLKSLGEYKKRKLKELEK